MRTICRIIGKFAFLLAGMGFFMPVACDKNAFQLVDYVDKSAGTLIYVLFILAAVGVLIGVLLLAKVKVPILIDWVISLACIGSGLTLLDKNNLKLQYGAHVIITGFIAAAFFVLIASFMRDADAAPATVPDAVPSSASSSESLVPKRCLQCSTVYSGAESVCPQCNSYLFEEVPTVANAESGAQG